MPPRPASSPLDHHVAQLEEARDVPVLVKRDDHLLWLDVESVVAHRGRRLGSALAPLAGGAAASASGMRGFTLTITLHGTFIGLESLYRSVTLRPTMCEPKQKSLRDTQGSSSGTQSASRSTQR